MALHQLPTVRGPKLRCKLHKFLLHGGSPEPGGADHQLCPALLRAWLAIVELAISSSSCVQGLMKRVGYFCEGPGTSSTIGFHCCLGQGLELLTSMLLLFCSVVVLPRAACLLLFGDFATYRMHQTCSALVQRIGEPHLSLLQTRQPFNNCQCVKQPN